MEGNPDRADVIQRRTIDHGLDIHPSRKAIMVHYAVEAKVVSQYGEAMVTDSKECVKIVNVKNLSRSTNIASLAQQVVATCPLIDPEKLPEVEQLLLYLQARKTTRDGDAEKDVLEASTKKLQKQMEDLDSTEEASVVELDTYLEGLYDDLSVKTKSTALILQLAREPENLVELASNNSLLSALSRVLRDDWKKSIDLTTNILYIFFCFSTFSDFHRLLTQHKIGSLCISVIEHELKRHRTLVDDVSKRKRGVKAVTGGTTDAKKEYEEAKKRYQLLLKKQETLLRVCLYLLLNLAEDTRVELKMHSKGLVPHLLALLERENMELLTLVVSFLKKMSIFKENKDKMAEGGVIKRLVKLIPNKNEILMNVILRLLLNLSFDPGLCQEIVREAFLPKLTALIGNDKVVLCILYHISFDRRSRAVFAYTDCIPKLMKMILECPENRLESEVIALGINLASTQFGAEQMCKGPGLKLLMRRVLKTGDPLLMKMLRNISQHRLLPIKKLFLGYIPDLVGLVKGGVGEAEEAAVEAVGILSNLSIPELDFGKVVRDLQLLPFLMGRLRDPDTSDDMLLEVVVLCGTFSQDEACGGLLVQAGLLPLLIDCLKARQEEDELVLQIVYVFYYLILHQSTRHTVLYTSQAPEYLLELMNDKNKAIGKLCTRALDIIAEEGSELGQRVKNDRFRWHNCNWLEMVTGESLYEEDKEEDEEYCLDYYLLHSAAELDNPDYFYSPPITPTASMPIGDISGLGHSSYPLSVPQYYNSSGPIDGISAHPPEGYDLSGPFPPKDYPFSSTYEEDIRMHPGSSSPLDPRPMSRMANPLASPGMLFERDEHVEASSISAQQLMPAMEDPLALYGASFKTSLDLDHNVEFDDAVHSEGISHTYASSDYPATGLYRRGGGHTSGF